MMLVPRARLQPPESPRAGLLLTPLHGQGLGCMDRDKPSVFTGDTVPDVGKKNKKEAERSAATVEQ